MSQADCWLTVSDGVMVFDLVNHSTTDSIQVAFLGFSQGSMLAALLALELSKPCAGLVVLCGNLDEAILAS